MCPVAVSTDKHRSGLEFYLRITTGVAVSFLGLLIFLIGGAFHMTNSACQVPHNLIQIGRCPLCNSFIIDGEINQDRPRSSGGVRWNISTFVEAFDTQTREFLLVALSAILLQVNSTLESFLPIIRKAITHLDLGIRRFAVQILKIRSCTLLTREAELLEMKLQSNPDDLASRILLLCYYFTKESAPFCSTPRYNHVFWIIEKIPCLVSSLDIALYVHLDPKTDSYEICQQAKELWFKQIEVNEKNPAFLESLAEFFSNQDPNLSETFYKEAIKLEPNNIRLRKKTARFYELGIHGLKDEFKRKEQAKKALVEYETVLKLLTNHQAKWLWLLPSLAESAFEAGELTKAWNYAQELLRMTTLSDGFIQKEGKGTHYGHLVLGRLALRQGDRVKAKWHLLQSGKITGSPALKSYGPSMKLAKDLLELGERDVVIQYLMLCSNFWCPTDNKLQKWISSIEHGVIPDFGTNL